MALPWFNVPLHASITNVCRIDGLLFLLFFFLPSSEHRRRRLFHVLQMHLALLWDVTAALFKWTLIMQRCCFWLLCVHFGWEFCNVSTVASSSVQQTVAFSAARPLSNLHGTIWGECKCRDVEWGVGIWRYEIDRSCLSLQVNLRRMSMRNSHETEYIHQNIIYTLPKSYNINNIHYSIVGRDHQPFQRYKYYWNLRSSSERANPTKHQALQCIRVTWERIH